MDFSFYTGRMTAELTVSTNNAELKEDLAILKNGRYRVSILDIQQLLQIVFQMNSFNNDSDVELVEYIIKNHLSKTEQNTLLEQLNEEVQP